MRRIILLALFNAIFLLSYAFALESIESVLHNLCETGEIRSTYHLLGAYPQNAKALHSKSELAVILFSDIFEGVKLHKDAKTLESKLVPPLAQFHLDGRSCAGLGDLYYVSAVIIKQMVDSNMKLTLMQESLLTLITLTSDSGLYDAAEAQLKHALDIAKTVPFTHHEDADHQHLQLWFRAALMTPAVYESKEHLWHTRELLMQRLDQLTHHVQTKRLDKLDEFVLSPTFYLIYQGYNDVDFLRSLHEAYAMAFPALIENSEFLRKYSQQAYYHQRPVMHPVTLSTMTVERKKVRLGFVSSFFRRHSVSKLFNQVVLGLNINDQDLDIFLFSAVDSKQPDAFIQRLVVRQSASATFHYVRLEKFLLSNRQEVTSRAIDLLVYLDIGMEPATTIWASARLAPIQVCVWGHPSTTGLGSIDYFLSSQRFHRHRPATAQHDTAYAQNFFSEQLVQFDSLGFSFSAPAFSPALLSRLTRAMALSSTASVSMQSISPWLIARPAAFYRTLHSYFQTSPGTATPGRTQLLDLLNTRLHANQSTPKLFLCPQHLPKLHPEFDDLLLHVLLTSPGATLVLLQSDKKPQWRRTVLARWRAYLLAHDLAEVTAHTGLTSLWPAQERLFETEVDFLLANQVVWLSALNPEEYLALLTIGDVMLDPYPFGGGVTTLEALAVLTPVVTLPVFQNVPQLAAGMISRLHLSSELEALLVTQNPADYLHNLHLLTNPVDQLLLVNIRSALNTTTPMLYDDINHESVREWAGFIQRAIQSL